MIEPILNALARASVQGAIAVGIIWCVCRIASRLPASLRCGLWRLGYIKFLAALLIGAVLPLPWLPAGPAPTPVPVQAIPPAAPIPGDTAAVNPPPVPTAPTTPVSPVAASVSWQTIVLSLYLIGVVVCALRVGASYQRLRRLVQSSQPASEDVSTVATEVAHSMRLTGTPTIQESASVDGPLCAFGQVFLPAGMPYQPSELRLILSHEFAHLRRNDLAWEWLAVATQILFFFHPLVVLLRREEREAREAAADALALQATGTTPATYGTLLLSVALRAAENRSLTPVGSMGVFETGASLNRRLQALRNTTSTRGRLRTLVILVPSLVLASLLPWQLTYAAPRRAMASPVAQPSAQPQKAMSEYERFRAGLFKLDGDRRIEVNLTNEKGQPFAGVELRLERKFEVGNGGETSGQVAAAKTNADGHYVFTGLPEGEYLVRLTPTNKSYGRGNFMGIPLKGDTKERLINLSLTPGIRVTGRITDESGKPVPDLLAYVNGPLSRPSNQEIYLVDVPATVDAQGNYSTYVPVGKSKISVRGSGRSSDIRAKEQPVVAVAGKPQVVNITVSRAFTIAFVDETGAPIVGMSVSFYPDSAARKIAPNSFNSGDQTNAQGRVNLTNFDSGFFRGRLGERMIGGRFTRRGSQFQVQTGTQTASAINGTVTLMVSKEPDAYLTGRVVSQADGKPIPGAYLRVSVLDGEGIYGLDDISVTADTEGRFHIPLTMESRYDLYARADGYARSSGLAENYIPKRGEDRNLGDIALLAAEGTVSGQILSEGGLPTSKMLVYVKGNKTGISSCITDTQGRFILKNIVPGEHMTLEVVEGRQLNDDSSTALSQSNDSWFRTNVTAGMQELKIILRKADISKQLPVNSP